MLWQATLFNIRRTLAERKRIRAQIPAKPQHHEKQERTIRTFNSARNRPQLQTIKSPVNETTPLKSPKKFITLQDERIFHRRTQSVTPQAKIFNPVTITNQAATSPNHMRTFVTTPDSDSNTKVTPFKLEDETSPGPSYYNSRIHSCILAEHRQISFTKAKRFITANKPSALPTASLYDTRNAVHVLLKKFARVGFTQAKREISPPH
jgi:hypothetical protein